MSEPAYYLVGDKTYYDGGAREIEEWLFWGPQVLEPYLRVLGPPCGPDLNDVAFGGFALFPEERRLVWFGGESTADCPFYCRLYLKLMRAIWPEEWTIEWAGRGLKTLIEAAGRAPQSTTRHPAFGENGYLYQQQFHLLSREQEAEFGTLGAISIRYLDGKTALFPIHDGDVTESYLWAGPNRIAEILALSGRTQRSDVYFPDGPEPVYCYGGCHIDFQRKFLGFWSHCSVIDELPAEAWPGWTIVDWEERFEEHVAVCEGRLMSKPPPNEELLAQMKRNLMVKASAEHHSFYRAHEVYDEDWKLVEEIEFPVSLEERERLWSEALAANGL